MAAVLSESISMNNRVAGDTVSLVHIDLDYGPEFRGAICGRPNPVHLLFKQWQSIYWNARTDRNSNNCTYHAMYTHVRAMSAHVCANAYAESFISLHLRRTGGEKKHAGGYLRAVPAMTQPHLVCAD